MRFYLGIHQPHWLALTEVPLFISRRRLEGRKTLPRARGRFALDSGGFSELSMHGRWLLSARQYVAQVRRYRDEIGGLDWCAVQDWMCEPWMVRKTGLTVAEHQRRTLDSYLELQALAPELPWVPVLQGWSYGEYLDHLEAYELAGIVLRDLPLVGMGSVCRRQHMFRAAWMVRDLAAQGLKLHGFGFKLTGLRACADAFASADSMAWSFGARRERKGQQNSLDYALRWYAARIAPRVEASPRSGQQLSLFWMT